MNYAVFDIETNRMIEFLILGFFDGTEYRTFRDVKSFLNHLNQRRYNKWRVYAHYGGRFDFLFLMEDIFKKTNSVRVIEANGRIIVSTVNFSKATIHFVDSYALFPVKLADLTRAFKVEHVKGKMDFTRRLRVNKKLLKYLEGDCFGLYEVFQKFRDVDYIDDVKYTIGSQALDVFKRRFSNVKIESVPLKFEETFRRNFYSGGRVEVYKGYGTGVRAYDVNSLYPSVMLGEMPCGELKVVERFDRSRIGFYCVDVLSTPDFYISPYLVKTNGKNFYTNGKGRYYMSSATINYLRRMYGVRFRVQFGFVFSDRREIFGDYVRHFYRIKSESRDATNVLIAKLMLNSLYGKLGQSRRKETIVGYSPKKSFNISDSLSTFGLVMVDTFSRSRFILPYIAGYITELARLDLWKLFQETGERSCYYGDTDSIYTTNRKLDQRIGKGIGQLKCEGTFEGIFLLPKTYAVRDKSGTYVSFKGFNPEGFTWRDFKSALNGKRVLTEECERMLSFRECFSRKTGIERDEGFFLKMVTTQKTTDPALYDKRRVLPSDKFAFDTYPYYIKDV